MNLPSSAAVAAFALQEATSFSSRLLLLVQGLSDVNCNLEAAGHGKTIIQSGDALPPSRSPSGMSLRMTDSLRRPRHQRRHERCRVPHKLVLPP